MFSRVTFGLFCVERVSLVLSKWQILVSKAFDTLVGF